MIAEATYRDYRKADSLPDRSGGGGDTISLMEFLRNKEQRIREYARRLESGRDIYSGRKIAEGTHE